MDTLNESEPIIYMNTHIWITDLCIYIWVQKKCLYLVSVSYKDELFTVPIVQKERIGGHTSHVTPPLLKPDVEATIPSAVRPSTGAFSQVSGRH